METCTKCVLTSNFPGVSFDDDGVCNHCGNFTGNEILKEHKKKYEKNFLDLIGKYKGKHEYDVLMCFSGGKDSTYTMKIIKEKYGLTVLAVTFDNGFISPKATENMTDGCSRQAWSGSPDVQG